MSTAHDLTEGEFIHQRQLARSLIESVGYDAAIRYCQSNAWDGVMWSVLTIRDGETAATPDRAN